MGSYTARALLALVVLTTGVAATVGMQPTKAEARRGSPSPCIYDKLSLRTAQGNCRPRAKAYPANVKTDVQKAVYDGALTFGIPYSALLNVAKCESQLNPRADDGTHKGLFQFLPSTFSNGAAQLRHDTGIKASSVWNPLDASYVAGYLFVTGQSQAWGCEPRLDTNPAI
jgi:hypothetical protein